MHFVICLSKYVIIQLILLKSSVHLFTRLIFFLIVKTLNQALMSTVMPLECELSKSPYTN